MVNASDPIEHVAPAKSAVSQNGASAPVIDGIDGHDHSRPNDAETKVEVDGEGVKPANLPPPEVAAAIPCRFFPLGQCKYGDSCAFSHQLSTTATAINGSAPPATSPTSAGHDGPSPPPAMSQATTAVDFAAYTMAPVAPPYYYYGMPPQFYPPMPYPGSFVDANGYPVPMLAPPFVDYSASAAAASTVAPPQAGNPAATSTAAGMTSPLAMPMSPTDGSEMPRFVDPHPGLAEHMAALALSQNQALQAAGLPPMAMSPPLLPQQALAQSMSPGYTLGGHERRMSSNTPYYTSPVSAPRPMGRSQAPSSSRRSSTVGPDPSLRTASAIISFPSSSNSISGPSSPGPRSFPAHSRYPSEPGTRPPMQNGGPRPAKGPFPCAFFPENRCRNGDECQFTHLLPSGDDARLLGKGMIGIDGRTTGPAESSKSFVFPTRGGRGGMRTGGAGRGGLRNSFAGSRGGSFGAYGAEEMNGGVMVDGEPRRFVDDEARERVERFLETTRTSMSPGRSGRPPAGDQRLPTVGDFPALADQRPNPAPAEGSVPVSPKLNGVADADGPSIDAIAASKLAGSFASAAARGAKAAPAVPKTTDESSVTVPVGASA